MAVRAVLHPASVTGLAAEVKATPGVDLIEAADDAEVEAALADGVPILLTYTWRDRFLQPGLQWIQGVGAGFEQYPLDEFDRRGVALTTATGVHVSVAEGAFGLLLALTRRIADAVRDGQKHEWIVREGPEVAGSTVGIVGLGTIGEAFARRAQGWEVDLLGYKRHPEDYDGVVPRVFGPGQLLEMCRLADILVVTMPGSPETHHLIGAAELEALGSGYLINVGRGSVVDEQALIRALESGGLRGAGLDVFEVEPLPADSPLWDMPNVVITPHSAGDTPRYGERLGAIFRQNLRAFQGEEVAWVNRVVQGRRHNQYTSGQ
jgi:D-2-hydroxyacid dehydrogenase (NADP+)